MTVDFIPNLFLPRGIRNNNPGNIRLAARPWQGQRKQQSDPEFVEFEMPVYGLRALMRVLMTYAVRHGLNNVQSVINRWAPPHENATNSYVHAVCRAIKKSRADKIDLLHKDILIPFAQAIVRQENGRPPARMLSYWYPVDYYVLAYSLTSAPQQKR